MTAVRKLGMVVAILVLFGVAVSSVHLEEYPSTVGFLALFSVLAVLRTLCSSALEKRANRRRRSRPLHYVSIR